MKERVKAHCASRTKLKEYVNSFLLDELKVEFDQEVPDKKVLNQRDENIVYYIAGYMVHRFLRRKKLCELCKKSLDCHPEFLSEDFPMHTFTKMKSQGRLKFASRSLFHLLNCLEILVQELYNEGEAFRPDSFLDILHSIAFEKLPKVGCDDENHCCSFMSSIIYDYLLVRFKFIGEEASRNLCDRGQSQNHSQKNVAKLLRSKTDSHSLQKKAKRTKVSTCANKENVDPNNSKAFQSNLKNDNLFGILSMFKIH